MKSPAPTNASDLWFPKRLERVDTGPSGAVSEWYPASLVLHQNRKEAGGGLVKIVFVQNKNLEH